MAITPPANFARDIASKDTNLVPIVVIGDWANAWNSSGLIQISTK